MELAQGTVGHLSHAPQRMIQGNPLLEGNVTEHALLLFVVSAHTRWMLHPRSRCEITDFFRSLFSLCTAAGPQLKPHRLKPVLLDRAGLARSPLAVRRAGNFHGVFVRNANQEIKFSAGLSEYENKNEASRPCRDASLETFTPCGCLAVLRFPCVPIRAFAP